MRPIPKLEGAESIDEEDFEDSYWLLPSICPELHWDLDVHKTYNFS